MRLRVALRTLGAIVGRPTLWPVAVAEAWALAPTRWWSRPPFLPLPDADLLRFRLVTAYGRADQLPARSDVLTWLAWCRDWRRNARSTGRWEK